MTTIGTTSKTTIGTTSKTTIGIDVGGTKVLGVVTDEAGNIVAEERVPTPAGADALMATVLEVVDMLLSGTGDVSAIGVGVPGLVDRSGTMRFAPNLPGVVELPVAALVAEATGLPVRVDNDATAAMWAESRSGAAQSVRDAVMVTLGTGIGGGILMDGRLVRGSNGFGGEIGHMVVEAEGIACVCGRKGCWERYASGSALGRMGREAAKDEQDGTMARLAGGEAAGIAGVHVTAAAAEGDPVALGVMEHFGGWFALGLANLVHILDVELCVVGGGLVEAEDVLFRPIRRAFALRIVAPEHRPGVRIVPARLGERAGAIGAALLAREA